MGVAGAERFRLDAGQSHPGGLLGRGEAIRGVEPGGGARAAAAGFGARAGRDLLLAVALDESALTGHRVRALELLAAIQTLWPTAADRPPAGEPLEAKEQAALIDRVAPLLKDPAGVLRLAAARTLTELSAPQVADLRSFRTDRALPALTAAYKVERPGDVRGALAEAVAVIGGPKQWEELTGDSHGVVASLRDPGTRQAADAYCWLVVQHGNEPIRDLPTLLLERLDEKQKVIEKKEIVLASPAIQPPPQEFGWTAGAAEHFTFSMADLTPGLWRMTVKGVAGADKAPWKSEPRLLHLAPPPKPELPNSNPTAPRIVFDP